MKMSSAWLQKASNLLKFAHGPSQSLAEIDASIEAGRPDIALLDLESLDDSRKKDISVLQRFARAYQDLQHWQEASDAWAQLIKMAPEDRSARISWALAQYELGYIEVAQQTLKDTATHSNTREASLLHLIDIAKRQRKWESADRLLQDISKTNIDGFKLQSLFFNTAIHRNNLNKAETILEDGIAKGRVRQPIIAKLNLAIAALDIPFAEDLIATGKEQKLQSNKEFRRAVSQVYELKRDYEAAIELCETDMQSSNENPLVRAELARLLIMSNRNDLAVEEIEKIPMAWHRHRRVAPLNAFALSHRNRHKEAKSAWRAVHFWSALHTCPSLSVPVKPVYQGAKVKGDAPVKLYTTVRNEALRLPWFLSYYRSIGIQEFYIIDNGSSDSTASFLRRQDDVTLFHTDDSFRDNLGGTYWINYLIDTYGAEDWALYVDVDEYLHLPKLEKNGIYDLIQELESREDEAVFAPMLDMFPARLQDSSAYRAGDNPVNLCPYFDNTLETFGQVESPYKKAHGGASERFAQQKGIDVLTKTPLFKAKSGVRLFYISHKTTPAKISTMSGALLHFKFLGNFVEVLLQETERNDHFGVNRRYRLLVETLKSKAATESLLDSQSVKFQNTQQLLDLGIISDFQE